MTRDLFVGMDAVECGVGRAQAAAGKADSIDNGWTDAAVEGVRRFARSVDTPFTIEVAREYCPATPEGADARAWGAVAVRAIRAGYIRKTGVYTVDRYGSPKPLYERGEAA